MELAARSVSYQIPSYPSLGLVIGTHGTPGYVHLQLEAMRRFNEGVPVLVVDDCSDRAGELAELCKQYGAEFQCGRERLGHAAGDLSVFVRGLQWAKSRGFDLLVKFSRRWLPFKEWADGFRGLAYISQHHTYSGRCDFHNWGFRTECLGMAVNAWYPFINLISDTMESRACNFVEGFLHQQVAQQIVLRPEALLWESADAGFCEWYDMFSTRSRMINPPGIYWHDISSSALYRWLAEDWNLSLSYEDF